MNEITNLSRECYRNASNKGFYDDYARVMSRLTEEEDRKFFDKIWLSHRLMLIVSELAEGLEAIRDDNYSITPTSGGLGEELCDTMIRILDLTEHRGMDLNKGIIDKMAYNETRPNKHNRSL